MRPTLVRQPSAEEIEPEDSLVPTPIRQLEWDHHQLPLIPSHWSTVSGRGTLLVEVTVVTVEDAEEGEGASGSGNQAPKPSSMKRYKWTAKRIVKRPPACKSPFCRPMC
ncbi:hypothetical protein CK203_058599 [Vitis vinifera]|uniref:Uncharacterized protein n=1 Tax=Vitis vinifera TaxID=29760 RepID=A0A438FU31_VITVI|nr:hypothetical protein CK203_058599 [Vitis vinifera]